MNIVTFPTDISGYKIFFVGIKGTGMSALAELLQQRGAVISGSDVSDVFYTDEILSRLKIPVIENFDKESLPADIQMVIHSSAYSRDANPQLVFALHENVPVLEYSEALGELSKNVFACGISGVHGKTTTTALAGTLLQALGIPGFVLAGSGVANFGGSSVFVKGGDYFIAETCEYKRHFLHFFPDVVVITSIEPDHLDYFKDMDDILDAFITYGLRLPKNGHLVFCADDPGALKAAAKITTLRSDIRCIEYGEKANGQYKLVSLKTSGGRTEFQIAGFSEKFYVKIPGHHFVLDAIAAFAVCVIFLKEEGAVVSSQRIHKMKDTLESFRGSKRRSEIIGEWNKILIMDDYGHHPTEIKTTLEGLREFYPERRLVVDFMSHTYSRTKALLDDFSGAFGTADILILHKIYASAREEQGPVSGRTLFEKVKEKRSNVYYFEEVLDALPFCMEQLIPGDIFITIGAGDNWVLGEKIAELLKGGNRT